MSLPLLVSTEWLGEHLEDPDLRVFDCTGALADDQERTFWSKSGRSGYEKGHVPGAGYLDLHEELSDPDGRFMFTAPPQERLVEVASRHGVGPGTRVVLYSAVRPSWATRVWWLLRLFGFDDAAVLDGGWEKWVAEGRPVSGEPSSYPPARFEASPRPELLASTDDVRTATGSDEVAVVNALPEDQHTGESETHYGRPGCVPGSLNVPYVGLLDPEDGTFLPREELRRRLEESGALAARSVVTYCGGGIGATAVAFALALVGRADAAVYDGSMHEWSADPFLPVERGKADDER